MNAPTLREVSPAASNSKDELTFLNQNRVGAQINQEESKVQNVESELSGSALFQQMVANAFNRPAELMSVQQNALGDPELLRQQAMMMMG